MESPFCQLKDQDSISQLIVRSITRTLSNGIQINSTPYFGELVNFSNSMDLPTHRWFRYREGYSPQLVEEFTRSLAKGSKVLDPFCGSGTTLVASQKLGLCAFGLDVNPLATFVSRIKTMNYSNSQISQFLISAREVLDKLKDSNYGSADQTRILLDSDWKKKSFNSEILATLLKLRNLIKATGDKEIGELLFFAWISIIESVSNTKKEGNGIKYRFTKRTKKGYIQTDQAVWEEKNFGPDKRDFVINKFNEKIQEIYNDLSNAKKEFPEAKIYNKSAMELNTIFDEGSIDICIFSPPYVNAFDYFEIFKLELWLGGFINSKEDLKAFRKNALRSNINSTNANINEETIIVPEITKLVERIREIGSWSEQIPDQVLGYFQDMETVLRGIFRSLKPGGKCIIVVGNSAYSGVVVPTDLILGKLGKNIGFQSITISIARSLTTSSQQKKRLENMQDLLRESIVQLEKPDTVEFVKVLEIPTNGEENGKTFSITSNNISYVTHLFHKYPAKFIPHIPRWAIRKFAKEGGKIILDPFCGSGTTLVEAMISGNTSYGVDIDPMARLISKVKTTFIEKALLERVRDEVETKLCRDIKGKFYPKEDLTHWFTKEAIRELSRIRTIIEDYKNYRDVYDFLIVCFSSIIRRTSNADNESQKTYVSHTNPKIPEKPVTLFLQILRTYTERLLSLQSTHPNGVIPIVLSDAIDARSLSGYWFEKIGKKVDLVITSPPYIKSIDYIYNQMIEYFWIGDLFGMDVRELQHTHSKNYIGTQAVNVKIYDTKLMTGLTDLDSIISSVYEKNKKFAYILARYFIDMEQTIKEMRNILIDHGHFVIVVGNSMISDCIIDTDRFVTILMQNNGFIPLGRFTYEIKNRYMRFDRAGRGGIIKNDHVMYFQKDA